jgi:protein-disulfide isomerase
MIIRFSRMLLAPGAIGLALLLIAGFGSLRTATATDAAAPDKAAIETIVRAYILAHPEVIEEAMALNEKKHQDETQAQQQQAVGSQAAMIFNSPNQVVLGNPKGDVTLVEFFDYNCGYCKQALPDMLGLLDSDKNLRMVLKEFPILTPGSLEAARVAIAVEKIAPEKYAEFHKQLLGGHGAANKARAMDVVKAIGLDTDKVEALAARNDVVGPALNESHKLADSLGLNGTPSYIIGSSIIPGAIGIDRLKDKIAEMRATCKADGGVKPC